MLTFACNGSKGTDTSSTTEAAADASSSSPGRSPGPVNCRLATICEHSVHIDLDTVNCEPIGVLSGDAQCALRALADNEMGKFAFGWGDNVNCWSTVEQIQILGDGTALLERESEIFDNGPGVVEPQRRVRIQPREFFAECQTSSDPAALFHCVQNWVAADFSSPEACCLEASEDAPVCDP